MIFRRTDRYGYSRYYGGGGPAFVIKVIVTIAVVAALVLGGIALALQRYMVYTANGGHLELPWANSSGVSDDDNNGDNNGGLLITEENGDQSADAAEISADASSEADASADPVDEGTNDADAEPEIDASTGTDASEVSSEEAESSGTSSADASDDEESNADTSAESDQDEEKVGFFQRIRNFFANLFAKKDNSGDISLTPDEESSAAESSASEEPDSSEQADSSASGDESAQTEPKEETTTRPEALTGGLLLQHVSIGDVTGGFAEGDLKNVSANGIMLYLKESSGALNYASSLDLSAVFNASCSESKSATIASTIAELSADGYYALAYVDCFQDGSAGELADYQLYDADGDAWYDGDDCAWADPANEDFQNYIVGMVQELAAMGYDEIVLNNAAYPSTGDTDSLSGDCYDPDTLEDTISAFYAKLAQAVEGTDAIVSVITTADAITGGADAATGQTLENMLQLGGRLWVEADADDAGTLSQALTDAGYPDNALGLLVSSLDDEADYCQMNLD